VPWPPSSKQHKRLAGLGINSGDNNLIVSNSTRLFLAMEHERVAARLRLRDRFTDADLDDAVRTALRGLIQQSAA
jgi:hypothetical protein